MEKILFYTIFKTRWGWFGLCGTQGSLVRTCLPEKNKEKATRALLSGLDKPQNDPRFFKSLQDDIKLYYEGSYVDFRSVPVCLDGFTTFQKSALLKLKNITYGNIITYKDLAKMASRPKASRAIGMAMAKNPLPLIIPCHRVVRTDGALGGFSASGGILTKQKMIDLEKSKKQQG